MLKTIRAKFIFNLFIGLLAIIISVAVSFMISMSEIKTIMQNDIQTVSKSLGNTFEYLAKHDPNAYKSEEFKRMVYDMKIGTSGYVYLINNEGTMVVHPTKEGKNYSGHDYIDHIRSDKKGGTYEYISATTKQEKIVGYAYIEPWGLWVIPGVNKADYFDSLIEGFIINTLTVGALLTALLTLISRILGMSILQPIKTLTIMAKDLAEGDGDLTKRLNIHSQNEIGVAAEYIDSFIERIQSTVDTAKHSASDALHSGEEMSHLSGEVVTRSDKQNTMTLTSSTLAQEVGESLDESSNSARITRENLTRTSESLEGMISSLSTIASSIQDASMVQSDMAEKLSQLNNEAEQVKQILTVISDIADQTNLLALNAAIEAARAGEHGRGFAVVADEVRQLADRTQKALSEINATINVVVQAVGDSSDMMSKNASTMEHIADEAKTMQSHTHDTRTIMSETIEKASQSATLAENALTQTQNLVVNMNNVAKITEDNTQNVHNINTIAKALSSSANELNGRLDLFRTQ